MLAFLNCAGCPDRYGAGLFSECTLRDAIVRTGTGPDELLLAGDLPVGRSPDHGLESRALLGLAAAIARAPNALPHCLIEAALAVTGTDCGGLVRRDPRSTDLVIAARVGPLAPSDPIQTHRLVRSPVPRLLHTLEGPSAERPRHPAVRDQQA